MINANKAKQDRELTDDVREKPATIVPFAPMPKAQVDRQYRRGRFRASHCGLAAKSG